MKPLKHTILLLIFIFSLKANYCNAQNTEDERIQKLIQKKLSFNKEDKSARFFKVLIYNGNEKESYQNLNKFTANYKYKAKIVYDNPAWKVKTSAFISKVSAERALLSIREKFPYAVVIEDSLN